MRGARIKAEGAGHYHCISRIIERRMVLGEKEKECFRKMMRKVEDFSGVQILTYAILNNHFHTLLYVPEAEDISDEELIRRLRALYDKSFVDEYARSLSEARAGEDDGYAEHLRQKYLYRMYDMSEFMKSLKQRFSTWYNRNNERKGTLWEERYRSVLIEDSEYSIVTVGCYIDLNPVRAGIVKDARDYRYCGYGEAVGGGKRAREGIKRIWASLGSEEGWSQVSGKYRQMLYAAGQETEKRGGFSWDAVQEVLNEGGKLSVATALRCRVRYFTDGLVLGSNEFVEKVFTRYGKKLGLKKSRGACQVRQVQLDGLCTMREPRGAAVSIPV